MVIPEHEIATLQLGERHRGAECALLHVAVAWAGHPACRERELQQAGAVETKAGLAAPQIRHAEKPLGDGDEVWLAGVGRLEMTRRHKAVAVRHRQWSLDP